jgi:hypothetical protein
MFALGSLCSSAQAAQPALHWVRARGAEGCIDPIALAHRVEAFTGPVFVAASAAELSLAGEVAPEGRGFRVRIALSGSDGRVRGERVIRGGEPNCRSLDPAIAFIMALTLDPSLSLADAPAEVLASFSQEVPPEETLLAELSHEPVAIAPVAPPPPPAARPPAPAVPLPRADRAEEPRRERTAYNVTAGAQLMGYVLPSFAPGLQLGLGVAPLRWLVLSLGLDLAFGTRSDALPVEGHASFRALGFALRAQPRLFSWQRFTLSGILGGLVTDITARGMDFRSNRTVQLWLPALSAGLLGWFELPKRVALWGELAARVRLSARRFDQFTSSGQAFAAHRPGPVGMHIALGAGYSF